MTTARRRSGPGSAPGRLSVGGNAQRDIRTYIRWAVYSVLAAVAAFAFFQSYVHIYDLGRLHAQRGETARLLPLSVDLLIVAATLVIYLQKAEDARPSGIARWLPRGMLYAGIGATVAANVLYGLPYGWLSAVISAWPGAVFAGLVEMVLVAVRPVQREAVNRTVIVAGQPAVPSDSHEAARTAYAASVAGANPLTPYALNKRFGITLSQARKIVAPTAAEQPAPELVAAGQNLSLTNGDGSR